MLQVAIQMNLLKNRKSQINLKQYLSTSKNKIFYQREYFYIEEEVWLIKRSINTSINTIENKDIYIPNIPIDNKDVVEHKPSNK